MCLSNVYENRVEQKNLILSNVQRIDCKDGFVVLVDPVSYTHLRAICSVRTFSAVLAFW